MEKLRDLYKRYIVNNLSKLLGPEFMVMMAVAIGFLATDTKLLMSAPVAIAIAVLATAVAYWLTQVIYHEDSDGFTWVSGRPSDDAILWAKTITFIAVLAVVVIWLK